MLQQMGNDDETKPNGGAVEPEVPEEDAEVVAERLWGQVTDLSYGRTSIKSPCYGAMTFVALLAYSISSVFLKFSTVGM